MTLHALHRFRSILVPTDQSQLSHRAEAHALALALTAHGRVTLAHTRPAEPGAPTWSAPHWAQRARMADMLAVWGHADTTPTEAELARLGLTLDLMTIDGTEVAAQVAAAVRDAPPDLLVAGTHARTGIARLLSGSVAEDLARALPCPALFLPRDAPDLIDLSTGRPSVTEVLVPAGSADEAHAGMDAAIGLLDGLAVERAHIRLVHVGQPVELLEMPWPNDDGRWTFDVEVVPGEVVPAIVAAAARVQLVVMPTRGPAGLWGALTGSRTETVLRQAGRPVLAVPLPRRT